MPILDLGLDGLLGYGAQMTNSDMELPLKVEHLSKSYGRLLAVNDVSFEIKPGEVFGLLGPNGAGKTSIISTIVTLEKPTLGKVKVFGKDVTKYPNEAKSQVGWVPQEVINHGFFNVEEIIQFHSGYFGKTISKNEIDNLLKRLDLYTHRKKKVKQLSGGMKRRLMIAKALCHDPKILLLDEPTAGVDIDLRESLWDFVTELKNSGVSILLTTHYLEEAERLCDRVGFISGGSLFKVGPTSEIINDFTKRTIEIYEVGGNKITLKVPMEKGVFECIKQAGIDSSAIQDIKIIEGDLEDAFRAIMKEGL